MKTKIKNGLICLALILGLAGCGKKDTVVSEPDETKSESSNIMEDAN